MAVTAFRGGAHLVRGVNLTPLLAVFRFLTAVLIHGLYDFMVLSPGMPVILPVMLVIAVTVSAFSRLRVEKDATPE
jgi:hypothetical protein